MMADLLKPSRSSWAEAVRFCRQDDSCCKIKNQTILGNSCRKQGGRPLSRDGYATASFLMRRGRKCSRTGGEVDGNAGCQPSPSRFRTSSLETGGDDSNTENVK